MISGPEELDPVAFDDVDQAVFSRDPPCPGAGQFVLQRLGLAMPGFARPPELIRLLRCISPADIEVPLPRGLLTLLLQAGEVYAAVTAVAVPGPLRVDGMLQFPVEGRPFPPFLLGRHGRGPL